MTTSKGTSRVRLLEAGWDRSLDFEASSEPLPAPTGVEVLVEVGACGVCHRDLLDREGRFPFQRFPITPGHEAAGVVVAVGPDVRDVKVGDHVATMHRDACGECAACRAGETSLCEAAAWVLGILADGGYARRLVAPESALYRVPAGLAATQAAVLHCTFGTAYRDLVTLGGLRGGMRVLVTGANGGVGGAGVQIAKRLGAEVVAVLRDARHADYVRSLGADHVVIAPDGAFRDTMPASGIDLALDSVGAPTFLSTLRSLRVGGRLVVVGNVVAAKVPLNLGFIITRGLTVVGGSGATRREMEAVLALHDEAPFTIAVDRTLPLSRADEAQRLVRAGGLTGRVVLVPEP